jgi:hypothetical protein
VLVDLEVLQADNDPCNIMVCERHVDVHYVCFVHKLSDDTPVATVFLGGVVCISCSIGDVGCAFHVT